MPRQGTTNVALPTELVDAVREVVADRSNYYTGLADFVREALREKLERVAPHPRKIRQRISK